MRNTPRPEAEDLEKLARDEKLDIRVRQLDVLLDDEVEKAVADAEQEIGRGLDVLVNNAGIGITGPVEVQDMEATKLAFDTNVLGYHRLSRAVLPGMRAGSRHLFAISSQLGRVIVPYAGHYSATKFAVEAMFEQLAYELVPHNIGVLVSAGRLPHQGLGQSQSIFAGTQGARRAGAPRWLSANRRADGRGRCPVAGRSMDVPRTMAKVLAMPPGTRPLRLPVSGGSVPQTEINAVTAKTQVNWLGESGYGPLIRAVHEA